MNSIDLPEDIKDNINNKIIETLKLNENRKGLMKQIIEYRV